MKSKKIAYGLWLVGIFGCLGFHRFYLGKVKTAFLWLFSGGLLGVGALIDLFSLGEQVRQTNSRFILEKLARGENVTKYEYLLDNKTHPVDKNTYCPYCKEYFHHQPKRDLKCPFCHCDIYYQPDQKLFNGFLLTSDEAAVLRRLTELKSLGISKFDFIQKRQELVAKFGAEITGVDILWNLICEVIINSNDHLYLKKIYRQIELFLHDLPYDHFYLMKRTIKMQLIDLQRDIDIRQVRIISTGSHSCPSCQSIAGRVFTIEEALTQMPLPCKGCTRNISKTISGFCQCRYQGIEHLPSI